MMRKKINSRKLLLFLLSPIFSICLFSLTLVQLQQTTQATAVHAAEVDFTSKSIVIKTSQLATKKPVQTILAAPTLQANPPINKFTPAIVVGDNIIYGVWQEEDELGHSTIRSGQGAAWFSDTIQVNGGSGPVHRPDLAMYQDTLYAVWLDGRNDPTCTIPPCSYDIFFATKTANGTWNQNEPVNDDPGSIKTQQYLDLGEIAPSIALDAAGNAYAVWVDDRNSEGSGRYPQVFFAYRPQATGQWQANEHISSIDNGSAHSPAIVVDADGNAHAIWVETDPFNDEPGVFVAYRSVTDGIWQPPVRISSPSYGARHLFPHLAVDPGGDVYATWIDDNSFQLKFNQRPVGGDWGSQVTIDHNTLPSIKNSVIGVNEQNYPFIGWTAGDGVFLVQRLFDGQWGTPIQIDPGSFNSDLSMAVDSSSTIHLAWTNYGGDYPNINYAFYEPIILSAALSQVTADKTSVIADGQDAAVITAIVNDTYGRPLPDRTVHIQASPATISITQPTLTTDTNGRVQATVQSTQVQTVTLTAVDQLENLVLGQPLVISFTNGPATTLQLNGVPTQTQALAPVSPIITLFDASGHQVLDYASTIHFTSSDSQATLPADYTFVPGLDKGRHTFAQSVMFGTTGTQTLQVADTMQPILAASVNVQVSAATGVDNVASTLSFSPTMAVADGLDYTTLSVSLLNSTGTPVAGQPVTLQLSPPSGLYLNGQPVVGSVDLGSSDENGLITAVLTTTNPGLKTASACADTICLLDTASVFFTPNPVDSLQSSLTILGRRTVAADGQSPLYLVVTARDKFGNLLPDVATSLTLDEAITVTPLNHITDASGQARYELVANQPLAAVITATADGVPLNDTVTATFMGADLAVGVTGPTAVTPGFPLSYQVTIANQGLLPATDIIVTNTLPSGTSFVTQTSPYPYTYFPATNEIQFLIDTLPVRATITFEVQVNVPSGAAIGSQLINQIQGTLAEADLNIGNNAATITTTVVAPYPELTITPQYPTLIVPAGLTNTRVITLSNTGTASLNNLTVSLPPHIGWVSLTETNFGSLNYGQFVTFTVTADAAAVSQNGYYRDRLHVATANAGNRDILLNVRVTDPLRDLRLTLTDSLSQTVRNAHVTLTETLYVVTEGNANTAVQHHAGFTDENGHLTLSNLESGKSYAYHIKSGRYGEKVGTIFVAAGQNPQEWQVSLPGQPRLSLIPDSLTFSLKRGDLAQQTLTIRNNGTAPITNIAVTKEGIPFLFLGQPAANTVIPPGGEVVVTVNAAPILTETSDFYQGSVSVSAADNQLATIPVTVRLHDGQTRTLCVQIETEWGQPLSQATIRLKDLVGQSVGSGELTEIVQPIYAYSTDKDGPGYVCFPDLPLGAYGAEVGRNEVLLGEHEIKVVAGDGIQEERMIVEEPSVHVNWSVLPTTIEDIYTTVMTLTFIPYHVPQQLAITPRWLDFCGDDDGVITQTLTVHNFYPVTLTHAIVHLETEGNVTAKITKYGTPQPPPPFFPNSLFLGTLPPKSHTEYLLTAALTSGTCTEERHQGFIYLDVEAKYKHDAEDGWYRIDATPAQVPLGEPALIPLKLINTGFSEEGNLNTIPPALKDITLTPPQNLTWITVTKLVTTVLAVGEEIGFHMVVNPPQWLPEGMYYDHIQVTAVNGITALIGIEAEMTGAGLRVETQFVTPLRPGSSGPEPPEPEDESNPPWDVMVGDQNDDLFEQEDIVITDWPIEAICVCLYGGVAWNFIGSTMVYTGTVGSFHYEPDFKSNVVILQITQRYSLDREAFSANLNLANGLESAISDIEVSLFFEDITGQPIPIRIAEQPITATGTYTPQLPTNSIIPTDTLVAALPTRWQSVHPVNFIAIPETPTELPIIPSGYSQFANWTLIPDAPGLMEQARFNVYAVIHYKANGIAKTITTMPASISVQPQPRILLDYYLPNFVLGGETFEWLVIATNIGFGTAHNFRVETPQPKIIKQSELYPTDFELIGPSVLEWGDVASGEQVTGTWRILPSNPGSFVDWQAACKHQNYKGVELPQLIYCEPRVHFYDTSYLAETQDWHQGDSCGNSYQGDPIDTFSGNFGYSIQDVHIPTWGPPLTFIRSYNSRDSEDGPFGPGWTHNYNMDLVYESFIGLNENGIIGQQTYFAARLPHGSIVYFEVSEDGNTITPYPGVRATLIRDFDTYTLTLDCNQTKYFYNTSQKLVAIEDRNGNRLELDYDAHDNLISVTGPAGRQLAFAYDAVGHITKMTDPLNRSTNYTYTAGYLVQSTDFRGNVTHFSYTSPGYLVSMIDPNGHTVFYNEYDNGGRVLRQEDGLGHRLTFAYALTPGSNGRTTTTTDPLGNVLIDFYDSNGRLVRQEDAYGFAETYVYDEDDNQVQKTDKNGNSIFYSWNECGCEVDEIIDAMGNTTRLTFAGDVEIIRIEDERGNFTHMTYDENSNLLTIRDPLNNLTTFTYGSHGEKLSEEDANGSITRYGYDVYGNTAVITDALGHVTTMSSDLAGRLLSRTDTLGRTTHYTYDATDNILAIQNPLNQITAFTYDNVGNMLSRRDALNQDTFYEHDARNDVIRITDTLGGQQTFVYDANRNLIAETDANGHRTTYAYDKLNRRITVTDPLSDTVGATYDPVGNRLSQTDARGYTTQYIYDANDRLVTTIYADGSQMHTLYDTANNAVAQTDAENRTVSYAYDALGRLTTEIDFLGGVTNFAYDGVGNQTAVTDAENHTTTYAYDALNRLVKITDALNGETVIAYDAVGNQIAITDATDHKTTFTYDDLDRLLTATDPLSGTSRYVYDAIGNQIQIIDPLNRIADRGYDSLSRLITETNSLGHSVHYAYDAEGNLRHFTDEEGRVITYTYDALNRLTVVANTLGGTTFYEYDANGNLTSKTDAEGRTSTYVYDNLNQLIAFHAPLSGTVAYTYDAVGNLIQQTDANGRVMHYTYDGLDRVVQTRNPASDTRHFVYDRVGNLLTLTDEAGSTITHTYDALNRLTTVMNPLGHTSSYTYDPVGNLIAETDAEERPTTYAYDALNRPLVITNSLGFTSSFAFDAVGNQLSQRDERGFTTFYKYNALNQLLAITNPLSGTTYFTYSPAGNLLSEKNPLGQVTAYAYDALNRLIQITDDQGHISSFAYDGVGNALSFTDVQNRTTAYQYDARNRLVRVEDPLANVTTFAFDAVGNQISQTDANGRLTQYTYDAHNWLVAVTDPLQQVTRFTYDEVGNQLTLTDPLSRTTTFTYDAAYRLTQMTDAAENVARYTYDKVGNQTAVVDAEGRTITTQYDALNRPVHITDPLSGTTSLAYDALGNLVQLTDPENRLTQYSYDPLNRLLQVAAPLSGTTSYAYDALGSLLEETDANGRHLAYQYDNLNRLLQVTNPLSGTTHFTYSPAGNLLRQQNPLGQITRYEYDALNRIITVTNALSHTSSLSYDAVGNLINTTDANGRMTHLQYDALNRLTAHINPLGQTTRYEYDAVGNNTAVIDPLGHKMQQTYDPLDRLITVIDPLSRTTTYDYDDVGNIISMVDGNGVTTRYDYDPLNRLNQVTENYIANGPTNPSTNVATTFAYDKVGNLTHITNPLEQTTTYHYDARNRLATVIDPLNRTTTYQYDPVGNRQQMTDPKGQVFTYNYDALHRLTTLNRPDEVVNYTYDALGNRLSLQDATGVTAYDYDDLNRLTADTDPLSQTVQYTYDAVGNRTALIYPDGAQVQYSYDLANQLLQVTDWDNSATQYNYDDAGRLHQILLPNGVTGTFGYDGANQLTLIQYETVTDTLATYIYSYDQVGNRIQVIETAVAADDSPTAVFTATPRIGAFPLTVTFANLSSNVTTFIWDFGDGTVVTTSSTLPLDHIYTQAGAYTVTLTAINGPFSQIMARTNYILVAPPDAFQELDGLVVMEAENAHAVIDRSNQGWVARTGLAGYLGAAYVQALPDRDALYTTGIVTSSPELQYLVHFVTPGTYTVWAYGSAANSAGDSLHVGLNGNLNATSQALTGLPPRQWGWSAQTAVGPTATLTIPTPGVYTITVWAREDGVRLDRLLLTLDEAYLPSNGGPAESPRVGDGAIALMPPPPGDVLTWFMIDEAAHEAASQTQRNMAQTLALILSNPGVLFMAPLALIAPFAYRRKRKRGLQLFTGLCLLLGLFGLGFALLYGGGLGSANAVDFLPGTGERDGRFNPFLGSSAALGPNRALADLALQASSTRTIDYSYDPLYRLTHANYSDGSSYGYSYDAAGNRQQALVNGAAIATYTYDASNWLTHVNSQPYSYDANGNLLDDGTFSYTYDSADRLTQIDDGVSIYEYVYNGDGLRVAQDIDGLHTDYVQDIAAGLPQVLTARQGGTVSKYLRGLGLIGEQRGGTGPFAGAPTWHYVLPDALGSVRQLTNATGQVSLNQDFDPFGGLQATAGNASTAYGFAGEAQEAATGHIYLRARTYNPGNGRFLQQDTLMGEPSQPRSLHRYAYAFNNPINYTDPSGHMPNGQDDPIAKYNRAHNRRMRQLSSRDNQRLGLGAWETNRGLSNAMNGSTTRSANDRRLPPSKGPLDGWLSDAAACSVVGSAIGSALDLVESAGQMLADLHNAAQAAYNYHKTGDEAYKQAAGQYLKSANQNFEEVLDNPVFQVAAELAIAFSPIGEIVDLVRAVFDENTTDFDIAMTVADILMGEFDDLLFSFGHGSRKSFNDYAGKGNVLSNFDEANSFRHADDVGDVRRVADDVGDIRRVADDAGDVRHAVDDIDDVRRAVDDIGDSRHAVDDASHAVNSRVGDVSNVNRASGNVNDVRYISAGSANDTPSVGASCATNSFVAGTLVTTAEGLVPIEEIDVGDQVLGEDPETGQQGYYEVVALTDHPTDDLLQIVIGSDDDGDDDQRNDGNNHDNSQAVMLVTPEHPIYVEGTGWLLAENLTLGARLRRADGGMAKVLAIDQLQTDTPQAVYNFTVRGPHTYFVNGHQWLVHNNPSLPKCGWGSMFDSDPKRVEQGINYENAYTEGFDLAMAADEMPYFGRFGDLKAKFNIDPMADNLDDAGNVVLNVGDRWNKAVNRGFIDGAIDRAKKTGEPIPLVSNPIDNINNPATGEITTFYREWTVMDMEGFTLRVDADGTFWAVPPPNRK